MKCIGFKALLNIKWTLMRDTRCHMNSIRTFNLVCLFTGFVYATLKIIKEGSNNSEFLVQI